VDGVSEAVEIALGASTSCARVTSGSVLCWGRDTFGQLGRGEIGLGSIPVPGPVVGLDDAIRIDFGSDHGCAIRASGDLVCWGRNQYGRLGDGTLEDRGTPVLVLGPSL
jgi:alpha-tubulin suppressor-like RCC1 family protein